MKYIIAITLISMIILTGCSKTTEPIPTDIGESIVNGKTYVSEDPQECVVIKFICEQGMQLFFDETGCGCELIPNEGKLQAHDCPTERPKACTKEYIPVCGQVQVQCITTPCVPVIQTFDNKCEACANSLTISYTEGACEEKLARGIALAGTQEEQCINNGGTWTGYDCEDIDINQCQRIGGKFNECASACRNNPEAELCTLQCVQVCEFN